MCIRDRSNDNYHGYGELHNLNQKNESTEAFSNVRDLTGLEKYWKSYTGEFYCGSHHGLGTLIFTNGNKYHGSFQNDKIHGKGNLSDEDGTQLAIGEWVQSKLVQDL
eukprot:TRINITY_DN4086_c0_g1_i4.p1 TRINITY_DN4086_c0_g1~~TRINITY_DN4086_c0_g1_i4.p1  ORF type:complete len:107 (-),score=17.43 TRINITY_DN4086_c0_g1_i4:110-430(-)